MSDRKVRMGIDVGGTHTKAVAIDNATHEIIGKSSVKTTHDDKAGVATGVVQAFQNCLRENGIDPKDVIFVSILVSSVVFGIWPVTNAGLRTLIHLVLLPLVVGITYEFNR